MTNGELLYLLLVLAGFGTFMLAVAWADHQYRHMRRPAKAPRSSQPVSDHVHAR